MSTQEKILIIDFEGKNGQYLSRLVRKNNVYSELAIGNITKERMLAKKLIGIILVGSGQKIDTKLFDLDIPILAIGESIEYIISYFGGKIEKISSNNKKTKITCVNHALIKAINIEKNIQKQLYNIALPNGFASLASLEDISIVFGCDKCKVFGTQLNPKSDGLASIVQNFLYNICNAKGDWSMSNFAKVQITLLKEKLKDKKVLLGLSGGVDSSVCAAMLHKAVGDGLICVFVDHGLLRKKEVEEVQDLFGKQFGDNLIVVDAKKRFLQKLQGVCDPEQKRKIIGNEFIKVFEEESKKIGKVDYLAQGTIYPDIVESGGVDGSTLVKSHHNVGGLPSVVDFEDIIEPLRDLFKDEVRKVGCELGLPESMVMRQPFPGPGLGIRVIGEVTEEKLEILKEADYIYREEIAKAGLDKKIWQYFAVITNMKSVGMSKDARTYDYTIALRAVNSVDAMSAEWYKIPFEVLEKCSYRITKEIKGVNRVVYDITNKPPATIEWE